MKKIINMTLLVLTGMIKLAMLSRDWVRERTVLEEREVRKTRDHQEG